MKQFDNKMMRYFSPAISILSILILWWLINFLELANPLFVPDIGQTGKTFFNLFTEKKLFRT